MPHVLPFSIPGSLSLGFASSHNLVPGLSLNTFSHTRLVAFSPSSLKAFALTARGRNLEMESAQRK